MHILTNIKSWWIINSPYSVIAVHVMDIFITVNKMHQFTNFQKILHVLLLNIVLKKSWDIVFSRFSMWFIFESIEAIPSISTFEKDDVKNSKMMIELGIQLTGQDSRMKQMYRIITKELTNLKNLPNSGLLLERDRSRPHRVPFDGSPNWPEWVNLWWVP